MRASARCETRRECQASAATVVSIGIDDPNAAITTSASTLLGIEMSASNRRLSTSSTHLPDTAASETEERADHAREHGRREREADAI